MVILSVGRVSDAAGANVGVGVGVGVDVGVGVSVGVGDGVEVGVGVGVSVCVGVGVSVGRGVAVSVGGGGGVAEGEGEGVVTTPAWEGGVVGVWPWMGRAVVCVVCSPTSGSPVGETVLPSLSRIFHKKTPAITTAMMGRTKSSIPTGRRRFRDVGRRSTCGATSASASDSERPDADSGMVGGGWGGMYACCSGGAVSGWLQA